MTPWWLVMLGGVLGSSHCVGMCGGFAAMIGLRTSSLTGNLRAQGLYSLGRLISYGTLGAVAGFAGKRLVEAVPQIVNVPAILCLIAGIFLIREGLLATGLFRHGASGTHSTGCLIGPLFSTMLRSPGARNTFVAGIATGLMPCGLVYAFVSLAGSSGDLLEGLCVMLAFGAGTVPLMVITGCGAALLSWTAQQRLWKIAAWTVVLTGGLTIARGVSFFQWDRAAPLPTCPFCAKSAAGQPETLFLTSPPSQSTDRLQ